MSSASDYLEGKILDHLFITAFTRPATVYAALYTAAPSDAGGGTEVAGNAYARVALTNDGTTWTRTGDTITNAIAITFPAPTPSSWGTVTHWALLDAATSGNLLIWAPLTSARLTSVGAALAFSIGDLSITAS